MSITSRLVASALALSLGAGAAFAQAVGNEARITHEKGLDTGLEQIRLYTVTQAPGGNNRIEGTTDSCCGANFGTIPGSTGRIQGSLDSLRIEQNGDNNVMGMRIAGKNSSISGSIVSEVTGDGNTHRLWLGNITNASPNQNPVDPQYRLTVVGDNNKVGDTLRAGSPGTLAYAGDIKGDGNTVTTEGSNAGSTIDYTYDIDGSTNTLDVNGSAAVNATRVVDVKITGSSNSVTQNVANGTADSSFTGVYVGSNIASTINQNGPAGLVVDVNVTNEGPNPFTHSVTQSGSNQSVFSTVVARNGGSYTITQDAATDGAFFSDTVSLAAGGTGIVSQ